VDPQMGGLVCALTKLVLPSEIKPDNELVGFWGCALGSMVVMLLFGLDAMDCGLEEKRHPGFVCTTYSIKLPNATSILSCLRNMFVAAKHNLG
jgi:hypothetical protein